MSYPDITLHHDRAEQEALRRIRCAARRGWSCRLRLCHVLAIAARLDDWLAGGLRGAGASRIRRARLELRGARLTAGECRDIAGQDIHEETP